MNRSFPRGWFCGLCVTVSLCLGACSQAAEERPAGAAAPTSAAANDLFLVPEKDPQALQAYIAKLQAARPEAMTYEAVKEFRHKQAIAYVTAGERLLAAQPNSEQFQAALSAKVGGLITLKEEGDSQAAQRMQEFLAELTKTGYGELARDVAAYLFERRLTQNQENPQQLAQVGREIAEFLKVGPIEPGGVQVAYLATRLAEQSGDDKLCLELYQPFGDLLAKHDNAKIAAMGRKMQGAARRLSLLGKTLELEGETVSGVPLSWASYRGRVTMVIFWEIACPPCREEIQSLREYYQQYHGRGFDVVGINLDEDRQELQSFLKENPVPWTVVFDQARAGGKAGDTMGTRYGLFSFPHTILVDRQGKVVALDARGPKVGDLLQELLGSPSTEPAAKP